MEEYYDKIKDILENNIIEKKVREYKNNRSDLESYYNVGKLLIEAQGESERAKYGDKIIKEYSKRLIIEIGKKYNERKLRRMRQFYILFEKEMWSPVATKISWSIITELLSIKDKEKIIYYLDVSSKLKLTKRELRNRIKSKEYERITESERNKLVFNNESINVIPEPVVLPNLNFNENRNEKILQKRCEENPLLLTNSLGEGYTYVANQYRIKVGKNYNYIDILLFNYIDNAFVVLELKAGEVKKEHIGQVKFYMNYIDKELKKEYHNKTKGIILCRYENKWVLEYIESEVIIRRFITSEEMNKLVNI